MRLSSDVPGAPVEITGLTEVRDFTIKVGKHAFKLLISGLYADKIGCLIRELSTNAWDAHLAIGKGETPFDVNLPTVFYPTFRVRDYGVSMSHEQVMRLMTTVFDSSKAGTNTQVGAFGLGSKSPFALVDTFSLNVVKDGEKRMYSAFIKQDGVPTLALLGREETTEPQGVEFTLTIDQKDIRAFKERAIRILRWFPTHPNVTENSTKVELPKAETLIEGKGWQILKSTRTTYGDREGAHARQGCVMYPINADAIPNITEAHKALLNAPLVIDFSIGSLDPTASREALSYEPSTCANIIARLNLVAKEITDKFGTAIKTAQTLWEAGAHRRAVAHGSGLPQELVRIVKNTKWKDTIVPDTVRMDAVIKYLKDTHDITVQPYWWDQYRIQRSETAVYLDSTAEQNGRRWAWEYGDDALSIFFTVHGDRPTYEGRRLRATLKTFRPDTGILLFALNKADDAKAVIEALGNPPIAIRFTKDLPAPVIERSNPAPARGITKKEEVKVRKIEFDPLTSTWVMRPEAVVPLDGTAYFARLRDGSVQDLGFKSTSLNTDTFLKTLGHAQACGYLPTDPIYLIGSVYQKRVDAFIQNGGAWKTIDEFVRVKAAADFDDKLFQEAEDQNVARHLNACSWVRMLKDDRRFKALAERLKVGPLCGLNNTMNNFDLYANPPQSAHTFTYAARYLTYFGVDTESALVSVGKKVQQSFKLNTLTSASSACGNTYPLVELTRSDYNTRTKLPDYVMQYIEAIDLLAASKVALKVA